MITAIVLAKNEEKNIEECLTGLEWCDELIVIDDESEDKTAEIAKEKGAKVITQSLSSDFAAQRNFGLQKAKGDWILFIDADERVTNELVFEIKEAVKNQEFAGYLVKRKDFIFGSWLNHGETGDIKLLRLARKGAGEWVRPIHESWNITGRLGELRHDLLHYPHPTVAEFLSEINFYTTQDAKFFFKNGVRVGFFEIIVYPVGKFFLNYFLKLGFLDGMAGILMSIIMSFHSFLTRGKIWQLQERSKA